MDKRMVDVIIPTYNRKDMLEIAIQSVLNQEYKYLNIIIIDNCSEDSTSNLVKKIACEDKRVKYICNDYNVGLLGNLLKAFEYVESEYFCILTDDDFITPNFISDAIECFIKHPAAGFVALSSIYVDGELNAVNVPKGSNSCQSIYYDIDSSFLTMTKFKHPFSLISVLFRKEAADLYVRMSSLEDAGSDIRYFLHAAAKYSWVYYSKIGACITVHPNSFSVKKRLIDWMHDVVIISRYLEIMKFNLGNESIRNICLNAIAENFILDRRKIFFKRLLKKSLVDIKLNGVKVNHHNDELIEFSRGGKTVKYWILYLVNYNFLSRILIKCFFVMKEIKFIQTKKSSTSPEIIALLNSLKNRRNNGH